VQSGESAECRVVRVQRHSASVFSAVFMGTLLWCADGSGGRVRLSLVRQFEDTVSQQAVAALDLAFPFLDWRAGVCQSLTCHGKGNGCQLEAGHGFAT
jgi:hypothetical protein